MKKILLAALLLSGMAFGQIARTGSCSAATASCTISAAAAGDLQIVWAYRTSASTAPSLPAGWTSIATGSNGSTSFRIGCRKASSTSDTGSGTWTNAAGVAAASYSGTAVNATADCNTTGVGGTATSNSSSSSTTTTYPTATLTGVSGTSWVAGFDGSFTATGSTCVPSGMSSVTTANRVLLSDTNGVVSSWSSTNCTTTNSVTWSTYVAEILRAAGNPPAATPSISPSTGTYAGIQSVTITDSTSGATICYTTDGSTPTANGAGTCTAGTTYSGAFNVGTLNSNTTVTVKAIASKSGNTDSTVASSVITTQYGPTPSISPAAGTYYAQQTITITCSAATPHYTTDGSTPTVSSTTYSGTFSGTASGSQTIKAVCADSTNAAGSVTSNAYVITPPDFTPSDVTVFTSDFSDVYDTNLEPNQVQQLPLDYGPTKAKWTAMGGISGNLGTALTPDNAIAPVPNSVCSTSSGYCAASNTSVSVPIAAMYTGKTGLNTEQFAETKLGATTSNAGPCVRMSGTSGYCAAAGDNAGRTLVVSATLYKITSGTWTALDGVSLSAPLNSPTRIRASQNAIQVLVNGSVVISYTDTASPLMTGTCGIGLRGGSVTDFKCGNIGAADATTPVTPTYPTYTDAPMSTSAWTMGYPWFQAAVPYTVAPSNPRWAGAFSAKQISGSLYGIGLTAASGGTITYRGGSFGSNQWQRVKIGVEPTDPVTNNWFIPLQHRTYVPGTTGGCAAAGVTAGCYDSVSYYPGVETVRFTIIQNGAATTCAVDPNKVEYACTPFMHITKVTPAASPANNVITVAGSYYTPRKGDDIYTEYFNSHIRVACKGNAANEVAWQANHAYALGTFILDSNRVWQVVKTAGTSGSSAPTWYAGWTQSTASGDTTNDGSVVWESYGQACPTSATFSWVIDAPDTDLDGASGIPGLWAGQYSGSNPALFYDWSAGTATSSTSMSVIGISEPSSYQPAPVIFW